MEKPKVGDKVKTWFSGEKDGFSRVLEVYPYNGKYKNDFTWVIRATAPNTKKGYLEYCI